jgi:hypothetical protein
MREVQSSILWWASAEKAMTVARNCDLVSLWQMAPVWEISSVRRERIELGRRTKGHDCGRPYYISKEEVDLGLCQAMNEKGEGPAQS